MKAAGEQGGRLTVWTKVASGRLPLHHDFANCGSDAPTANFLGTMDLAAALPCLRCSYPRHERHAALRLRRLLRATRRKSFHIRRSARGMLAGESFASWPRPSQALGPAHEVCCTRAKRRTTTWPSRKREEGLQSQATKARLGLYKGDDVGSEPARTVFCAGAGRLRVRVSARAWREPRCKGHLCGGGKGGGGISIAQVNEAVEYEGGESEHSGGFSIYALFISSSFAIRAGAGDVELSTLAPVPSQCR